jgi:hypothetical protein
MGGAGTVKRLKRTLPMMGGKSILVMTEDPLRRLGMTPISDELVTSGADGIVVGADRSVEAASLLRGRASPALLVSLFWSQGVGRDQPRTESLARKALMSGASAVVTLFCVGHPRDEDEADNLSFVASMIDDCDEVSMPTLVCAVPLGERASKENYADCIGLAARMVSEAGATCVAIPYPGSVESARRLVEVINVPTFVLELEPGLSRGQPSCGLDDLILSVVNTEACGLILPALDEQEAIRKIKMAKSKLRGGEIP